MHFNKNLNYVDGIAIHDIPAQKNNMIKYERRYKRLYETINNKDNKIFFIRFMTPKDTGASMIYNNKKNDWADCLDNIEDWIIFMDEVTKINKTIILILFDPEQDIFTKINNNIYKIKSYDWNGVTQIINLHL